MNFGPEWLIVQGLVVVIIVLFFVAWRKRNQRKYSTKNTTES